MSLIKEAINNDKANWRTVNKKFKEPCTHKIEKHSIGRLPRTPETRAKKNTRCTACGFIRYNTINLIDCPKCRTKDAMVNSHDAPEEAVALFCSASGISPGSVRGQKIKQAVDILYSSL